MHADRHQLTPLALLISILLGALPALATNGVMEINQACVSDGCFAGDAPGFPVTLASEGSYRLTSNLSGLSTLGVGQEVPLIEITADDVSLDLGGFTVSCRQPTIPSSPCSAQATFGGRGIFGTGINTSVRNGTIRGMADDGLYLSSNAVVEGVRAVGNANSGIRVQGGSLVRGSTARLNAGIGIYAFEGSTVTENASYSNTGDGFQVSYGSTVAHNSAFNNGGDGFDLGPIGGLNNVLGGLASENVAGSNDGFGLRMDAVWGYKGNVLTSNNSGNANPQVWRGINLGQNVCGSDAVCP